MVEPKELALVPLNEQATAKIEVLRKTINSGTILLPCFFIVLGLVLLAPFINSWSSIKSDLEAISVAAFVIGGFWLSGLFVFLGRIPKGSRCIHAQYGIVNGKWSSSSGKGNQKFYLDVVFPETSTRYNKAFCTQKDYQRVEQGQKVLVFVFEGRKRVCAVLLD